jgi:NCS1 family nucleobase:cation symporter-1
MNTKYGLEHFSAIRSVFGRHGIKPLIYILNFLVCIGWTGVLSVMFGRAAVHVINHLAGTEYGGDYFLVGVFGFVALAVSWVVVVKGPVALKWFNRFAAPLLTIVLVIMYYYVFKETNWSEMTAVEPLEPFGIKQVDFMMVVEFSLAGAVSWWPAQGNLSRLATTQRSAAWAALVGLLVVTMIAQTVGFMAALTFQEADPTAWMIPLAGPALGIVILLFIAFANITTISVQAYQVCVAMRQEGVKYLSTMRWDVLITIFLGLAVFLLIKPSLIYDHFFQFLYWIGLGYAPPIGIICVDYFIFRRQTLDVRALFDARRGSPYDFWRGWNIAAYIAFGIGVGTFGALMNPITLWYSAPFPYTSATMASMVVSMVAYFLLTRFWVMRVGKGGYRG